MLDLLVTNASLFDGCIYMSVAVQAGKIVEVKEGLTAPAHETLDAGGMLLSPPFIDAHFHSKIPFGRQNHGYASTN